jgi:hypothetical protein
MMDAVCFSTTFFNFYQTTKITPQGTAELILSATRSSDLTDTVISRLK